MLGGGLKHFCILTLIWGNYPIWLLAMLFLLSICMISIAVNKTHLLEKDGFVEAPPMLFWSFHHLQWWMPAPGQDAQAKCHGQAKTMEAIEISCPVQLPKIQPTKKQRHHQRSRQCWDVANLFRVLKVQVDSFHTDVPLFWQEAKSSGFLPF